MCLRTDIVLIYYSKPIRIILIPVRRGWHALTCQSVSMCRNVEGNINGFQPEAQLESSATTWNIMHNVQCPNRLGQHSKRRVQCSSSWTLHNITVPKNPNALYVTDLGFFGVLLFFEQFSTHCPQVQVVHWLHPTNIVAHRPCQISIIGLASGSPESLIGVGFQSISGVLVSNFPQQPKQFFRHRRSHDIMGSLTSSGESCLFSWKDFFIK
jgi:hypothetical protein